MTEESSEPPDVPDPSVEVIEAEQLVALESIDASVKELLENSPNLPTELRRLIELMRRGSFSGPLPPPEILEGYKAAYPEAPAIIFGELQAQGSHRRAIEAKAVERQEKRADRGQQFALIIVLAVLGICAFAVDKHEAWVGATLFGFTLVSIVTAFITGSRKQVRGLAAKRAALDAAEAPPLEQPPISN